MEIESVTIRSIQVPLSSTFVSALGPVEALNRVIIEIKTDEGVTGYGESAAVPFVTGETPEAAFATLRDILAPELIGNSPIGINRLLAQLHEKVTGSPSAQAAIDIALHDIRGKNADLPLYHMLGGSYEDRKVKVPKIVRYDSPKYMKERAISAVDNGYDELKLKVGSDPELDEQRVKAVSKAVPNDTTIRIDANQAWENAKSALIVLNRIESFIDVVEQPTDEHNIDDLALLRKRTNVPIMADESVWDSNDALKLVNKNAADMLNVKLMEAGGLTDAKKIDAIAESGGRPTQVGSMIETDIATVAGAHLVAASTNVRYNDLIGVFNADTRISDVRTNEPVISLSGPGLGIEIDRDELERLTSETAIVGSS